MLAFLGCSVMEFATQQTVLEQALTPAGALGAVALISLTTAASLAPALAGGLCRQLGLVLLPRVHFRGAQGDWRSWRWWLVGACCSSHCSLDMVHRDEWAWVCGLLPLFLGCGAQG